MSHPDIKMGGDSSNTENDLQPQETARERPLWVSLRENQTLSSLVKRISNPRDSLFNTNWQRIGRAAGALGVVGLFTLTLLPDSGQGVRAEEGPLASPAPTPIHHEGGVFSQGAGPVENQRVIESAPRIINFTDSLGRQRRWGINNAHAALDNPDIHAGVIYDYIDNAQFPSNVIQPPISLHTEINSGESSYVAIEAMAVDVSDDRMYIAESIGIRNGNSLPRLVVGKGINNPTSNEQGKWILTFGGLPQGGIDGDAYASIQRGTDAEGKFLELEIIHSVIPTQNGRYLIRLNVSGDAVGSFVKLPDPTPAPSPTPTDTPVPPTPTFTPSPSPTLSPSPEPSPTPSPTPTATPTSAPGETEFKYKINLPFLSVGRK